MQEVSEITRGLKALAKELDVPVLALSQLSRAVEQREDKRPQLADLRESGSIEQDADVVMFIYREEYYLSARSRSGATTRPTSTSTSAHDDWKQRCEQNYGKAEVIIAKQRHGPTGIVRLSFEGQFTKFGNLAGRRAPAPLSSKIGACPRPPTTTRQTRRAGAILTSTSAPSPPTGAACAMPAAPAAGRSTAPRCSRPTPTAPARRWSGRGWRPKAAGSSSSPISTRASRCAASCRSIRSTC